VDSSTDSSESAPPDPTGTPENSLPPQPKLSQKDDTTATAADPLKDSTQAAKPTAPDARELARSAVAKALQGWSFVGGLVYVQFRIKQLKVSDENHDKAGEAAAGALSRVVVSEKGDRAFYQLACTLESEAPEVFKAMASPMGQLGLVFDLVLEAKRGIDSAIAPFRGA
jgi:hypothetical protein